MLFQLIAQVEGSTKDELLTLYRECLAAAWGEPGPGIGDDTIH